MYEAICPAIFYFGTCSPKHEADFVCKNSAFPPLGSNTWSDNGLKPSNPLSGKFGIIIAHYIKIAGKAYLAKNRCGLVSSKSIMRAGYLAAFSGGG